MIKVGVVGPHTSVDKIISMTHTIDSRAQFVPFPYKNFQDTQKIIKDHDHKVDFWFFSGQLSYSIAKQLLQTDDHLVAIKNNEASLYKSMLQVAYHSNVPIHSLSIDEMSEETLNEIVLQLDMNHTNIYLKVYDISTNHDELIAFHHELWTSGKTSGAITSFEEVYKQLKISNIPAYWYSISRSEISQALDILKEKIKTSFFKDSQIGMCIIDIENINSAIPSKNSYILQYLEVRIKEILISLSEQLDGFLTEKGNGRYIIFSTRGAIEKNLEMIRTKIELLQIEAEMTILTGIGYGETVFTAEINALSAVKYSKNKENNKIYIIKEDGTIVESVGDANELAYANKLMDEVFLDSLKEANVSIRTYNRIHALLLKLGWDQFTTLDLTTHLQFENRNARRIINNLCKVGLVECIGESTHHSKGRPRKIYRLI